MKIYLLQNFDREFVEELKSELDSSIELYTGDQIPDPADYEILISGTPPREYLEAGDKLHTVIIPWAGLSSKSREVLMDFPHLNVHNLHYNDTPVAETAIALMMACAKWLIPVDRRFRRNDWRPRYNIYRSVLIDGKNALIFGYGAIGKEIARLCHGLGMKIRALRRTDEIYSDDYAEVHPNHDLHDLLKTADILFISAPLTPDTRGIIGKDELALLPERAILVNIARGPIVDESALFEELRSGRISAGLDVWYDYPKSEQEREDHRPSQYDFGQLDNVVMTPHMAERSDHSDRMNISDLTRLLNLAARGEQLPNKVDVEKGY